MLVRHVSPIIGALPGEKRNEKIRKMLAKREVKRGGGHHAGDWSLKDPLKRRWMEKNWSFAVNTVRPLTRRRNEKFTIKSHI
ncbi:MAG: hypothetical protein MOIL_00096 [Candidatus Methanolliviera sp. GoM_oil]|nr:MAG: hypothetical protein MOIL_00096 [Candidatus Methanolliviera sp. GoM_oil]